MLPAGRDCDFSLFSSSFSFSQVHHGAAASQSVGDINRVSQLSCIQPSASIQDTGASLGEFYRQRVVGLNPGSNRPHLAQTSGPRISPEFVHMWLDLGVRSASIARQVVEWAAQHFSDPSQNTWKEFLLLEATISEALKEASEVRARMQRQAPGCEAAQARAATLLQQTWRQWQMRRTEQRRAVAGAVIQRSYRRKCCRRGLQALLRAHVDAAAVIQQHWRRIQRHWQTRLKKQQLKRAVVEVQRHWRGKRCRQELQTAFRARIDAARVIQRYWLRTRQEHQSQDNSLKKRLKRRAERKIRKQRALEERSSKSAQTGGPAVPDATSLRLRRQREQPRKSGFGVAAVATLPISTRGPFTHQAIAGYPSVKESRVRAQAKFAMLEEEDMFAIAKSQTMLEEKDTEVRRQALIALLTLTQQCNRRALMRVGSMFEGRQSVANRVLAAMNTSGTDHKAMQCAATTGLGTLAQRSDRHVIAVLAAVLCSGDEEQKRCARSALREIHLLPMCSVHSAPIGHSEARILAKIGAQV